MYFSDILVIVITCLLANIISVGLITVLFYKYIVKNHMDSINLFTSNILGKNNNKSTEIIDLLNQIHKDDMNKIMQQIPTILNSFKNPKSVETEEEILLRTLDEMRTGDCDRI